MIRPINRDPLLLRQKAAPATADDLPLAADLLDTLNANRERCVGMAANMIGVPKRVIAVMIGSLPVAMLNPRLIAKASPYQAEEGCLSLDGTRAATRYRRITVEYTDTHMRRHTQSFTDWTAQIIQHELDHLEGVLI